MHLVAITQLILADKPVISRHQLCAPSNMLTVHREVAMMLVTHVTTLVSMIWLDKNQSCVPWTGSTAQIKVATTRVTHATIPATWKNPRVNTCAPSNTLTALQEVAMIQKIHVTTPVWTTTWWCSFLSDLTQIRARFNLKDERSTHFLILCANKLLLLKIW